jgi:thioredoxin-like negative regulator of GroEL
MLPRAGVIALLLAAAAGCHRHARPPEGDVGSALALTTLSGDTFDPTTLRGKPAIVTFWRPGCQYCAAALPKDLEAAHASGAIAVAIMVSGDGAAGHDELAKLGWDGPELVDDAKLAQRYQIDGVPTTYVLRGNGTASAAFVGDEASTDDLAAAVSAAK